MTYSILSIDNCYPTEEQTNKIIEYANAAVKEFLDGHNQMMVTIKRHNKDQIIIEATVHSKVFEKAII